MPRTHVAASFLPSSFPFPFLSSFSHPPLHPLWTTSQSPNAALAARVVPLLLPLFFFYIFAFLVVASAPARQRATRANAPQRHGSTYALHLIDAFIVRTAVGLFALTKDRLVGGASRWKLRPFGISRLRHARKESNGNWNFFIREREREILGTSMLVRMRDRRRKGLWWKLCLFGIPSLRHRGRGCREKAIERSLNAECNKYRWSFLFFFFFERREKFSNRYLFHYVSSIERRSVENGRLIEGRVVRDLCFLGIHCVCDTRGDREERISRLQSIETTYSTCEVFPFGREKANLIFVALFIFRSFIVFIVEILEDL